MVRARFIGLVLGAALFVVGCSAAPVAAVPGRWQVADNPNAGLEVKPDGTFQGEIGPANGPRVRLNGKWAAKGNEVTFMPETTAQAPSPVPLVGKVDGDTMNLSASVPGAGTLAFTLKRRAG
jgi:hypothetical protein